MNYYQQQVMQDYLASEEGEAMKQYLKEKFIQMQIARDIQEQEEITPEHFDKYKKLLTNVKNPSFSDLFYHDLKNNILPFTIGGAVVGTTIGPFVRGMLSNEYAEEYGKSPLYNHFTSGVLGATTAAAATVPAIAATTAYQKYF